MHVAAVVRAVLTILGALGVTFSEDVANLIEQNVVAIVSAVVALVAAWPAIKAGFNKVRGAE